ncbi:uncharacterized protein F5147DRAFT_580627 [Suillus discolor]|uniref:Uncharacterized protein n=1 Tax=Suillus discolor TaxID=1912936 RepID=A0A9P7JRF2_9AGAM|nr:uncharacterized protein F5147DRAFT_580627 [Suillus discolor]KAG2103089.1 hypothetical protein F5147DRAFT_580627 [Suillus discolor]
MSAYLQYVPDDRQKVCDTCGRSFKPKGFDHHQRACEQRARESEEDGELWASIPPVQVYSVLRSCLDRSEPENVPEHTSVDDIRTEFHPHARITMRIEAFSDFTRQHHYEPPCPDRHPWLPFRCQLDFEVAGLVHETVLTHEQTTCLIQLVQHGRTEDFTLKNYADVRNTWEAASHRLTPFEKDTITVPLDGNDMEYTVYFRSLWDWGVDILQHPDIGPHCIFDAQQLSKFDGDSFIRFIDEPWTADAFWECQSQIPPEAKLLAFILYADKSKLSSFGHEKGYPVIARLANLPVTIRNRNGVGGGRVVGWLPLVKDDLKYKGTQQFANFKVAVWHAAFKKVLASIIPPSKHGHWANCWDDVVRLFYTLVLILSADYEEQSVMSLTRGVMSNFPCPICLIPEDKLSSVMPHNYTLRTCQAMNDLLIKARAEHRKGQWEAILKGQSIRDVDNTFHKMNRKTTDVHRALCYDRLHIVLRGLFGDHMWPELQVLIGLLGRDFAVKVDQNFDALPRWRNMNHFDAVMAITFTDGSKYEDIFKLIVFAAHDILPNTDECKIAYLLLRCIHAYLEVDLYAALEVHTTKMIAAGRKALQSFLELMNKYIRKSEALWPDKNWSFLKIHLAAHLFNDIEAKGATRNYNTKPNEKCHGPLKESYQQQTNFKNVAPQVHRPIFNIIGSSFNLDELAAYDARMDEDEVDKTGPDTNIASNFHIRFGSRQPKKSLEAIDERHIDNPSFRQFCTKLNAFLNALPTVLQQVNMLPSDEIIEFRFLKVNYESLVDFCQTTDYLRCSLRFHNLPQYDCIIVNTTTGVFFARLLFLFTCNVNDTSYPIALVHSYDADTHQTCFKDKHLKFWRVRSQPRETASEFILAESIIRGVALAPDPTIPGDFLVMDTVDSDIFLRMKQMHLAARHLD